MSLINNILGWMNVFFLLKRVVNAGGLKYDD